MSRAGFPGHLFSKEVQLAQKGGVNGCITPSDRTLMGIYIISIYNEICVSGNNVVLGSV